jgi:glutathione S-transferase
MKVAGINFEEDLRPFDVENNYADFFEFSPTGKVPTLQHDSLTLNESLAILEYLAELYPNKNLWPSDLRQRATARCIAHEMHAGFAALRAACPMNMRRAHRAIEVDQAVQKDVKRIEAIWTQCLRTSGGPFLFGEFCIADAMYAPVVNRLAIYELSSSSAVTQYSKSMTELDAWQAWEAAAREEPWVVSIDEV